MRRFELLLAIRRIGLLLTNLDVDSRPTQYCGPGSFDRMTTLPHLHQNYLVFPSIIFSHAIKWETRPTNSKHPPQYGKLIPLWCLNGMGDA
jgi:hypothetical protein